MKKNFKYAWLGAIALTGAMGFTACSSDNDVVADKDVNPTYNPETNSVTTQFVLNVAGGEMQSTRQSSTTVQKNANFRGMQNARIFAMNTSHPTWLAPYSGTETLLKSYDLGTLYTASAVSNEGSANEQSSSRRILELSLPLTTDAMLVYAKAIVASGATDEENGKTTTNLATVTDPKNITFNLAPRIGENSSVYEHTKALVALILNRIISAEIPAQTSAYEHKGITYSDLAALKWSDLAAKTDANGLEDILKNAYNLFTTIKAGEIRAGSAVAVKSQIYYLNKSINSVLNATATSKDELNAQRLAENISTRLNSYFVGLTAEATTDFHTLGEWDSTTSSFTNGSILDHLLTVSAIAADDYNASNGKYSGVTGDGLKNFPTIFNLPPGSAQLNFTSADLFSYKSTATSLLDKNTTDDPTHYMYPAELWYFDNSALRVSTTEKTTDNYPNGYSNWDDVTQWDTDWKTGANGIVTSTTRSVAVKNNINYGVAMLQTKIALAEGDAFADNRNAIVNTESDQILTNAQVSEIQLTGVLIGGQNNQVDWKYMPVGTSYDYMIYDTNIPNSGKIPTGTGNEIYTLVFDNYNSTGQGNVKVALEFKNGSKDFYGIDNLIPAFSTFYLVGELVLGSNSIANWDSYYAIPPYSAAGESQKVTRIFVQDYMTSATFKIGTSSLKSAFVTVPDLRSSQTSLGLSVDLKWQPGLSFNDVTLGGN